MTNEEVKEAVVEETEGATAEAEVVEATEEIKDETASIDETADTDEDELSPWYYFFTQGCGWCKKSSPIVEELIEEGHDILMLDLAEPDNQSLNRELQQEYNLQCGTPWFINADTGKSICGFREKDILEKWLEGEEIPAPPKPTGPPPKVPFHRSTNKENIAWKKEYKKWLKDNEHMGESWIGNQRSADKIIDSPRPKSDHPKPPYVNPSTTDEEIEKYAEQVKKWQEENKHLPRLQPVDNMINQIKHRRNQMVQQNSNSVNDHGMRLNIPNIEAKLNWTIENLTALMNHLGVKTTKIPVNAEVGDIVDSKGKTINKNVKNA